MKLFLKYVTVNLRFMFCEIFYFPKKSNKTDRHCTTTGYSGIGEQDFLLLYKLSLPHQTATEERCFQRSASHKILTKHRSREHMSASACPSHSGGFLVKEVWFASVARFFASYPHLSASASMHFGPGKTLIRPSIFSGQRAEYFLPGLVVKFRYFCLLCYRS